MARKEKQLNPQQIDFLKRYLNPKSKTFGNAYQSAVESNFSKEYAKHITQQNPDWLYENLRRANMLNKAERNLNDFLDLDVKSTAYSIKGNEYEYDDVGKMRIKFDTTKFVAERIGKAVYGQEVNNYNETKILVLPQVLLKKNSIKTNADVSELPNADPKPRENS